MQTNFPIEQLSNPDLASSCEELNACLQCGYCLNNCPTYRLLGEEYDSPRGRIYLINKMLEKGSIPDKSTVKHIDRCLSCLICMASCPSSVHYMHLLDHARGYIEKNYKRPLSDRMLRNMLIHILPYPKRFLRIMHGAKFVKPFSFALPDRIRSMIELIPKNLPRSSIRDEPQVFYSTGKRKYRVALMIGCVQRSLNPNINDATIRILCRHGCEVVIHPEAGCCGSLVHHMGKSNKSKEAAIKNIKAWMKELTSDGLDAIVVNTSGCGTTIKDYAFMFRNDELAHDAAQISELTKDISEFLSELDLNYKGNSELRVAYHATCSLQFGQRIRYLPKKLLKAAGFTILEPKEPNTCCGSGGTYNLLQPEISEQLKIRKIKSLESGSPDVIAAGNIGCIVQIGSGTRIPVVHTVELLDWATGGPLPQSLAETDVH